MVSPYIILPPTHGPPLLSHHNPQSQPFTNDCFILITWLYLCRIILSQPHCHFCFFPLSFVSWSSSSPWPTLFIVLLFSLSSQPTFVSIPLCHLLTHTDYSSWSVVLTQLFLLPNGFHTRRTPLPTLKLIPFCCIYTSLGTCGVFVFFLLELEWDILKLC